MPPGHARPVLDVLEPAVDGVLLLDLILARVPRFSLRSPLHIGTDLVPVHAAAMLGRGPTDVPEQTPAGHTAIFMCADCAIGGCGVITTRISREGGWTVWNDLGEYWPRLAGIGPFRFDTKQYEAVLEPLLSEGA